MLTYSTVLQFQLCENILGLGLKVQFILFFLFFAHTVNVTSKPIAKIKVVKVYLDAFFSLRVYSSNCSTRQPDRNKKFLCAVIQRNDNE